VKIKVSEKKNPIIDYSARFMSRYLKTHKRQLIVAAVVVYSLLMFLAGIIVHKTDVIEEKIKPVMKKKRVFLKHVARGMFLARPENITIDIAHKDFQKLEYKRQEALELNNLATDDSDFVPAQIRHNGKTVKVVLRLKGDHTDHFETDKWSFRIKVKGNETLFGMKIFSIQHPKTRNYIYEWLYHKALKKEGLMALRYDFINATVNGKDLGIYAIEEFFEKRLIENNGHREGPIIRFDETIFWKERGRIAESGSYLSSSIDAFQTNKTLRDPVKRQQFMKAISLLESFRKGDLKVNSVFDMDKLAKFFAVSDLMGSEHGTGWINMRFYFNPITAKLEPIGFDGTCSAISDLSLKYWSSSHAAAGGKKSFCAVLLDDREFYQKYIKELERISNPDYISNFFNDIEDELENKLNIIYKEFPYYSFSKDIYYNNIGVINIALVPEKVINAYFKNSHSDGIELELGNIHSMDVEVLSVSYKDSVALKPLEEVIFLGKAANQPVEYRDVKFFFPKGFEWKGEEAISDLRLKCRIFGTTQDRAEIIFPYAHFDRAYIDSNLIRQKSTVQGFEFLVVDDDAGKITILPGEWDLDRDLIIPKGFMVLCSKGTKINLSNRASIVSYSPVKFIGTKEDPIVIYSGDSTGHGMVVMADSDTNILKSVVFKDLAAPEEIGLELTGAITFYESPVEIHNCKFLGNKSEDGLNIIRSEFSIDDTLFAYTFSDAFDGDFTKGDITNSSFLQCGNDGIDISGSAVKIRDVFIDGAGDKGISVGESSNADIKGIKIKNSNIAVAGKDSSVVNIAGVEVFDCKVGFTVYRKKPEYESAKINIESLKVSGIEKKYLVEKGSKITVDKIDILPNEEGVYTLLYGKE